MKFFTIWTTCGPMNIDQLRSRGTWVRECFGLSSLILFEKFSLYRIKQLDCCFSLLLAIVYSIHLQTIVYERMNYQTNCNIMRLVLQRQPIIFSCYAERVKLIESSSVFIMQNRQLVAGVFLLPQGNYFKRKSISFSVSLVSNTVR